MQIQVEPDIADRQSNIVQRYQEPEEDIFKRGVADPKYQSVNVELNPLGEEGLEELLK